MEGSSRIMKTVLALVLAFFAVSCGNSLSVTFSNVGDEEIWVEPAEVMGHNVSAGVVVPGTGKTAVLYGTGRMPNPMNAVVCWRPYADTNAEPLCANILISRECLPKKYRQGRDDLDFEIENTEVSLVVRMSSQSREGPGIPAACPVIYTK